MENKRNGVHHCLNKVRGRRMRMIVETTKMPSDEDRWWSLTLYRYLLSKPLRKEMTDDKTNEEEVEEIKRRVQDLKRLVPGGDEMDINQLFEETANYIDALEHRVGAMRALSGFLNGLVKEKKMKDKRDF